MKRFFSLIIISVFILTVIIFSKTIQYIYAAENTFEVNLSVFYEEPPHPHSSSGQRIPPKPKEEKNENVIVPNVINFKAFPQENSIALTWKNPKNYDMDSVRIVKSDKFFPRDIYDGQIIFEGNAEKYIDYDVLIGKRYYYTIFVKDLKGNYSSGALAQTRIIPKGEPVVFATSSDPFADIRILSNVDPDIARLSLLDFDFIQDGRKLVNIGNNVVIDGSKNLTISLSYGKIPELLKTIAVTLIDPDDSTQVFPFLLRVNKDKTAFEATIAPLGKSGNYGMSIIVLDYKNQGLRRLDGSLKAFVFGSVQELFKNKIVFDWNLVLLLLLILMIIILYIVFRRREKKDNNEFQ